MNEIEVKDRCHLGGNYREASHQSCNLIVEESQPAFVPILFHTFRKNDSHFVDQTFNGQVT